MGEEYVLTCVFSYMAQPVAGGGLGRRQVLQSARRRDVFHCSAGWRACFKEVRFAAVSLTSLSLKRGVCLGVARGQGQRAGTPAPACARQAAGILSGFLRFSLDSSVSNSYKRV